jgi:leucyl/phenylalanyl-tRNA---protein transferase
MTILAFPPSSQANPDGLLAVGGDLDVMSLILAYSSGIFPWPYDEKTLAWYAPPHRALLFLDDLHLSKSVRKLIKNNDFKITKNVDFSSVIIACAALENRGKQRGTWITDQMIEAYIALHKAGFCHSYECFKDEKLVGGLYGVQIKKMFAGESMFYRESGASKVALFHLIEDLRAQGISWLDCQVITPLFKQFGAKEVRRSDFEELLKKALQ